MRKATFLKITGTLAAAVFSFGVMAQPATIKHTEDGTVGYSKADETILHTTGLGLKLYALPDPVYSPSYAGTGAMGNGLNAASQWRWVHGSDYGSGTEVKDFTNQNWLQINAGDLPGAGNSRKYWVLEKFGAAGCVNAAGATSKELTVTGIPTATMTGENVATEWTVMTAGKEFYRCGTGTDNLVLTFTEQGVTGGKYAYNITATVTGYDANGGVVVAEAPSAAHNISVAATDATFVASPANKTTATMTFVQNGGQDVRTKYVFTLTGVASKVSTVSHLRAAAATNTFYAPAATQEVTYWLNLPPVTGPIYHIPNTYAL